MKRNKTQKKLQKCDPAGASAVNGTLGRIQLFVMCFCWDKDKKDGRAENRSYQTAALKYPHILPGSPHGKKETGRKKKTPDTCLCVISAGTPSKRKTKKEKENSGNNILKNKADSDGNDKTQHIVPQTSKSICNDRQFLGRYESIFCKSF